MLTVASGRHTARRLARLRRAAVVCAGLAMVATFLLAACQAAGPVPDRSPVPSPVLKPLECEVKQYPCTLGDVPSQILIRSQELAQQAEAKLDQGIAMAEVASFLGGQDDIAEIASDEIAIRFRLEGGRPFWVVAPAALTPTSVQSGARPTMTAAGRIEHARPPAPAAMRPEATPSRTGVAGNAFQYVVGDSPTKRALVLSPYLWDFGASDDGATVAGILKNTRGYEGNVTFVSTPVKTTFTITAASFKGWDAYDVVHVVSHGVRLCDGAGCRALIAVHDLPNGILDLVEGLDTGPQMAVITGTEILFGAKRSLLMLNADFFLAEYPGGLSDAIVFFNACKTAGSNATDLSDAIRGTSSVYLGWSQSVDSGHALAAAEAFYNSLSDGGWPAETAHDHLGGLQTDSSVTPAATLVIDGGQDGYDLRIREVVMLLDPDLGTELKDNTLVIIDGMFADGVPDEVPFVVDVDGFSQEDAAGVEVHVSVDGHEISKALASGVNEGAGQWQVSGQVPLNEDIPDERPANMRAWIDLPDGGISEHIVNIRLGAASCLEGVWLLDKEEYEVYLDEIAQVLPSGSVVPITGDLVLEFGPSAPDASGWITATFLGNPYLPEPADSHFVSGFSYSTTAADGGSLFVQLYVGIKGSVSAYYLTPEPGVLEITASADPGSSAPPIVTPEDNTTSTTRVYINGEEVEGGPVPPGFEDSLSPEPIPIGGKAVYSCGPDGDRLAISPENSMRTFHYDRPDS